MIKTKGKKDARVFHAPGTGYVCSRDYSIRVVGQSFGTIPTGIRDDEKSLKSFK